MIFTKIMEMTTATAVTESFNVEKTTRRHKKKQGCLLVSVKHAEAFPLALPLVSRPHGARAGQQPNLCATALRSSHNQPKQNRNGQTTRLLRRHSEILRFKARLNDMTYDKTSKDRKMSYKRFWRGLF